MPPFRPAHRPGSRPEIPREEPPTPPSGSPISEELARALREPMPWYAALILRKLDQDTEIRDLRARLGAYEELVDSHEDALSSTKVTKSEEKAKAEKRREKREDRFWTVMIGVILAAILYAVSWLHVAPPAPAAHEQKVEIKP